MCPARYCAKLLTLLLAARGRQCGQALAQFALVLAVVVLAAVMAITALSLATNSYLPEFIGEFS